MFAKTLFIVVSNIFMKRDQIFSLLRFSMRKNTGDEVLDNLVNLFSLPSTKFSNLEFEGRGSSYDLMRSEG